MISLRPFYPKMEKYTYFHLLFKNWCTKYEHQVPHESCLKNLIELGLETINKMNNKCLKEK